MYRVRLTWEDSKSQIGAYSVLENAKKCADEHTGYTVYDGNGVAVYPVQETVTDSSKGGTGRRMKVAWIKSVVSSNADNEAYSTACVLWDGEWAGIIDFGTWTKTKYMIQFLKGQGIKHIDAMILSHYHSDHTGDKSSGRFHQGVMELLASGIDFTGATYYAPHSGIDWSKGTWSSDYKGRETELCNYMTSKGIKVVKPAEGQAIAAGSGKIYFHNVSSAKYANYYSNKYDEYNNEGKYTNYNNFSMIAIYKDDDNIIAFPGDIEYPAQKQNYGLFEGVDVLTVEHHDLDYRTHPQYMQMVQNARYAVIPQYHNYDQSERPLYTVSQLLRGGTIVYDTLISGTVIYDGKRMTSDNHATARLNGDTGMGRFLIMNEDLHNLPAGDYYVQNYSYAKTIKNYPAASNGGKFWGGARIKVLVDKGNGWKFVHKTILLYNLDCSDQYMAIQQYRGEEDKWTNWKYLKFS